MRYVNRLKVPGVCTRGPSWPPVAPRGLYSKIHLLEQEWFAKRNYTAPNLFSKRSRAALLIQPLGLSVECLIMLLRIWKILDSECDTGCPDCLFAPRQTPNYRVPPKIRSHCFHSNSFFINRLTPNNPYMGRTAPLTSKRCILYIYSTNIGTEYFKHALYSPLFSLFKMQFVS